MPASPPKLRAEDTSASRASVKSSILVALGLFETMKSIQVDEFALAASGSTSIVSFPSFRALLVSASSHGNHWSTSMFHNRPNGQTFVMTDL